jgi:hypothetical protein
LTVEAWLPTVERQASLTIERASGMSETMLAAWEQRLKEGQLFEPTSALNEDGEETTEETSEEISEEISEEPSEEAPELEAWPEGELDGLEMQVEPGGADPTAVLDEVPELAAHHSDEVLEEPENETENAIEDGPVGEDVAQNDDEDLSDFLNQFR